MRPDIERVIAIVREVASREILPRFRHLAEGEISSKRHPRDLVTIADVRAEEALSAALSALVPGSVVVGEEAVDSDPKVIERLAAADPVWVIDPIDGTGNFARGHACFAVLVALCRGGVVEAGWAYDPIAQRMLWAVAGQGAWRRDRPDEPAAPLRLPAAKSVCEMTGSVGPRLAERLRKDRRGQGEPLPSRFTRYGSTGREYMDLALGHLDFALYRRLKPWDHAAGVLIHREAGGFGRLRDTGQPYRPLPAIIEASLLLAPDEAGWHQLDRLLPRPS